MTYPIETNVQPRPAPLPLDVEKIKETMRVLPLGGGFVLPATECMDAEGRFLSTKIGQRVHQFARQVGIRITTQKVAAGLLVRREADDGPKKRP